MRGRKLLDQTLLPTRNEAGTLVFLLELVSMDPIGLPYQCQVARSTPRFHRGLRVCLFSSFFLIIYPEDEDNEASSVALARLTFFGPGE
jgi:hypothetical protein